jgi:hypothetical protein
MAARAATLPPECRQSGDNVTCSYTSGSNPFDVPAGVSSIHAVAVGGTGGSSGVRDCSVMAATGAGRGGPGATVSGDIPVTAGSTLYAVVGANGGGQTPSGAGGGRGGTGGGGGSFGGGGCPGGGASDVRSSPSDLSSRLIVAGGGGGAGGPVAGVPVGVAGGAGGAGGGGDGRNGASLGGTSGEIFVGHGGGGGTGGSGGLGGTTAAASVGATAGGAGGLGSGGDGGNGGFLPEFHLAGGAGGGGGGGLYGGGGGSGGIGGGGGGGGGSNLAPAGGSQSVDTTGITRVEISYTLHPTVTSVSCSPGTLAPGDSTICTATVRDTAGAGQTTPTGSVDFATGGGSLDGSPCTLSGSGPSADCSVSFTTFQRGEEVIHASYAGDGSHLASPGSTTITVAVPASTPGCVVLGNGQITATGGDRATFSGLAQSTPLSGVEVYVDHGPLSPTRFLAHTVQAVTCQADESEASVFGNGRLNGSRPVEYRIDVRPAGRRDGTYRIRLSNGYDSGVQQVRHGILRVRLHP